MFRIYILPQLSILKWTQSLTRIFQHIWPVWHSDLRSEKRGQLFDLQLVRDFSRKHGNVDQQFVLLFCIFIVCQCWQLLIIFILGRCPDHCLPIFDGATGSENKAKTAKANCLFKTLRKTEEFQKIFQQYHDPADVSIVLFVKIWRLREMIEKSKRFEGLWGRFTLNK